MNGRYACTGKCGAHANLPLCRIDFACTMLMERRRRNGDIPSSWRALKQSVVSGLSMAVCGIPWWNSDIGGFGGADTQDDDFRELIVRWFQFGLFCPVMRLHGARRRIPDAPVRNPGIIEPTGGPNEIWRFGDRAYGIIEKLIHLRERLRPYIHEQMEITSKTGMPLMRPMFYAFPEDKKCYELDDQYMFGQSILFAPIMQRGQTSREVYLPEGRWVLTQDGSVHEGGRSPCKRSWSNSLPLCRRETRYWRLLRSKLSDIFHGS